MTDANSPTADRDPDPMAPFARRTDYPLVVVTTASASGQLSGCLAGFVTQCSIRPARLLACISKVNHTFFVAERASALGVHLLGDEQSDVAALFGERTGDNFDKFDHCDWRPGETGVPVLTRCAAWLEGRILSRFSLGDHEAHLLAPVAGGVGPCSGLLTFHSTTGLDPGHPATA